MIELILFFVAWVDSPEGWQQWTVFTVENKTEVSIACNNPYPNAVNGSLGCAYEPPARWIFIWEPLLYVVNYIDKWGCTSILWHELLHARDYESERENWHGGSLRMSDMPCKL